MIPKRITEIYSHRSYWNKSSIGLALGLVPCVWHPISLTSTGPIYGQICASSAGLKSLGIKRSLFYEISRRLLGIRIDTHVHATYMLHVSALQKGGIFHITVID